MKDVRKTYAGPGFLFRGKVTNVLDRVSFTLKKGACTGLIGLSGAGKSTLSRILLGLEKADSGQVLFDGVTVHAWKKAHPGSLSIVLQNYTDSVNPNKTVGEIIEEPLRIAGLNTGIQQRTEEMLSKVGLTEDFAARFPHELSGGELQRVCIARALAPAPASSFLMKRFQGSTLLCSRTSCSCSAALKPLSQPGSLSHTI